MKTFLFLLLAAAALGAEPSPTAIPYITPNPIGGPAYGTPEPKAAAFKQKLIALTKLPAPDAIAGGNVDLVWNADAPTTNPATNATGYRIHQGQASGTYSSVNDVGNVQTADITLPAGTWFLIVTAYNAAGTDSPPSNEISVTVGGTSPSPSPSVSPTASPTASPTSTPPPTPSPTSKPTPTPTPTVSPSPTPGGSTLLGNSAVFTTPDNGNAGLLLASESVLSQPATIVSLSFYATKAGGNLVLGLYSGSTSRPSTLLAQTASFTTAAGWNTHTLPAPLALPAGTYWLAYTPSSNTLAFVKKDVAPGSVFSPFSFAPMPATFPTSGLTTTTSQWSFYATLNTGATPTPTPATPTPTAKPTATPTPSPTPAATFNAWKLKEAAEEALEPSQATFRTWMTANPPTAD
jgi:hypothetical protein